MTLLGARRRSDGWSSSILTVSFLMAILTISGLPAHAQNQNTQVIEEIIVTGNSNLTAATTDAKSDVVGVLDSLTAAQIDLTSDFTLAEAAARIPGVFGTSFQGQPRFLSLRGIDARYNSVSIDGNKIFNSSENNRGSQLDIIPASLINQIDVIKATTPDIDENSIGGHIAVRTLRAFDGGTAPYIKGQIQYGLFGRNEGTNDDEFSGRADLVGKFTFGPGNNYGVVVGFDIQQRASNEDYFNLKDGLQFFDSGDGILQIPRRGTSRLERIFTTNQRTSAFGKLETRATNDFYGFVSLNYFAVKDKQQQDRKRFFVDTKPSRITEAVDGFALSSRGTEAFQFIDSVRDIDTLLLSTGADYHIGSGDDTIKFRASWANVGLREDFLFSSIFENTGEFKKPRSIDIRGDEAIFTVDPSVSTAPASFVNKRSTFEETVDLSDDVYTIRAEYESNAYNGAEGFGFRVGGSWRQLDRSLNTITVERSLPDGIGFTFADNRPDITAVNFFDLDLGIDRSQYTVFFDQNATSVMDEKSNLGGDYELVENAFAGFVLAIYNGEDYQLAGGVRVVRTDVDVDNFTIIDDASSPSSFNQSYTNVLPSFHASYDIATDIKLRGSFTQTIGRPDFEAFAFGARVINDGSSQSITIGNSDLEERLATNLDFSAEYYFDGGEGLIAIGVFYKEIDNEQFAQTEILPNLADPLGEATIKTTTFSDNGSAELLGVEVSAFKEDFSFLHPAIKGLRLSVNYTYIDAELNAILDDGTPRTIDGLRNQPKQLFNAVASYKAGRFGASLAYNWQGEAFTGEFENKPLDGDNPGLNDVFINSFESVDVSIWYDVTDNLQVNAAVQNLTEETERLSTGLNRDLLRRSLISEASYWFGVKFKY